MRDDTGETTNHRYPTSASTPPNTSTFNQTTQTSAPTMPSLAAMFPRKFARFLLVTCLLVAVATVYVTLFKHPSADQLLEMNKKGAGDFSFRAFASSENSHDSRSRKLRDTNKDEIDNEEEDNIQDILDDDGDDDDDEKGVEKEDEVKPKTTKKKNVDAERVGEMKGKAKWERFITDNGHTAIGVVFDKCENPTEQLGTVILLPDKENGGVKSRTFYNFTLDRVIDEEGWTFNIDVKYNGQDLYDNWWEVCEMEEDAEVEDRTFVCPIQPGPKSLVKDKHIPSYIPKGRYESRAWVKDANNTVLLCGYSNFVL